MPNKKTKDDLLAEKVSAEKKLEQYTHQLQRAVNREKYPKKFPTSSLTADKTA